MAILGGQMYDTSDEQVASLLANRDLLHRALMIGARDAAGGQELAAIARVVVWICDAAAELAQEMVAQ